VGYPIFDLREWRATLARMWRAVEQAIIDTLAEYGIAAAAFLTGVCG
jgi:lipoate-protein ligase B